MNRGFRSLCRGGLLFAIALVTLTVVGLMAAAAPFGTPILGASVAHADAAKAVSSEPADGAVLPTPPTAITVTFDQQIGSTVSTIVICNGNPQSVPAATVSTDFLSLSVDLTATPLPKGSCNVRWSVIPTSETTVSSSTFSFDIQADAGATTTVSTAVEATAVADPTATTVAAADGTEADEGSTDLGGPLWLARMVSTLTVATLLGALVLITVAWPEGIEYILTIRFIRLTWITALVSTGVMVACLRAEATGTGFTSSLIPTGWTDLTDTTPGIAALARVVLVAAVGWVALRPERAIDPTTQLPALALPALAVATMGFSRTGGDLELIGYAAGVGHALAMAVWLGGLVLLGRVVLAGPGEDDLVHAVRGFGRLATPAMIITVLTGAVQLWRLDGGDHLTSTTHGRLMLLKVLPVLGMVVIGTATRQFVHSRMSRAESMTTPLAARLRRAVGFEAALGVLILGITSWMLSYQPGNLVAGPRSSADFAEQVPLVDATATLDAKLSLDPARVGRNEMLLEITKPVEGISSILLTFNPPASAPTAQMVMLTITEIRGAGAVYIARSVGVPLDGVGQWDVSLEITTTAGTVLKQNALLNVRADGSTQSVTIPTLQETPVTSPATSSTTTTVAG